MSAAVRMSNRNPQFSIFDSTFQVVFSFTTINRSLFFVCRSFRLSSPDDKFAYTQNLKLKVAPRNFKKCIYLKIDSRKVYIPFLIEGVPYRLQLRRTAWQNQSEYVVLRGWTWHIYLQTGMSGVFFLGFEFRKFVFFWILVIVAVFFGLPDK